MNFESIKLGFLNYLEEKLGNVEGEKSQELTNSSLSIFMYGNEFKDYLVEEVGADTSIFSKSINDIMSMELVNGKLIENTQEDNSDSFQKSESNEDFDLMTPALNELFTDETVISNLDIDQSGDLGIDEINNFLSNITMENENEEITFDALSKTFQSFQDGTYETPNQVESQDNILNRLLDKVYGNKTVIKTLDIDGDGQLNDEEKSKFEDFIKGYDGEGKELTEADIKRAFDDIMDGKFSYDNDLNERAKELDKSTEIELEEKAAAEDTPNIKQSQNITPSSGGSYRGGNAGSSNSFSSSNSNGPKTIKDMTLEELQTEKTKRESDVSKAQDDVNAVYSGDNSAVKSAQEDYENAKEDYDNAVENDGKISDELKTQRQENLDGIEAKQKEIDDLNIQINNQEGLVSEQKSTISADESNIQALNSALNALPESSDDPEKQAEINNKREDIKKQIDEAEQKLADDKSKLEDLNKQLNTLKENLDTAQEKLDELETTRDEIEQQILANCEPKTKITLEKFNEAKDNITQVKESELKTAKNTLTEAKASLDEINEQINIKQAEKTQRENSISEFDFSDFEVNLSPEQAKELEQFKANWEKNEDRYKQIEERTGVPAELIAALHWKESSADFETYLHNGDPLGKPTTHVPAGVYWDNWEDAAVDAVLNYGGDISKIEKEDIHTYYEYAERYNGLGYRNRGLNSPYVWGGTNQYTKGAFVADHQFDPNKVSNRVGVAVMLKSLLE